MKFNYKKIALVGDWDIMGVKNSLSNFLEHLNDVSGSGNYKEKEAFLNLPKDEKTIKIVKDLVSEKVSENLKYIFVVGIGGSNLGAKAVYDAIFGNIHALGKKFPKIVFLDTINQRDINGVENLIKDNVNSKDEVLINLISKSGSTTETVANFEVLYSLASEFLGDIKDRVIITTDKGSKLWESAEKRNYILLEIPKNVGGRYSVFSAVGLLPLVACGIDVEKLILGARNMTNLGLSSSLEENYPMLSAIISFLHYKNGKNINNLFFFISEFESLGKWYRQLMGESLGKEKNKNGEIVNEGVTPMVSIGSTDLHSMVQLYLGGPKDKFTSFVNISENSLNFSIPKDLELGDLSSNISSKSFSSVMNAIYNGVKKAYENKDLPYTEVLLDKIDEESLGEFLQFKMMEVIFLAELLSIDAFDQPNVEDYKKETRKILES